jgi:hypothetical protein
VTKGDAIGFYIDFGLSPIGKVEWGIDVALSRAGIGRFVTAAMSGTFVDGCGAKSDG